MMSRNEDILNAIIEGIDVSQLPDPKSREEALLMGVLDKLNNIEIDPEEIAKAVSDWLDDHPEATTTVEDGSITKAKLDSNLQGTVDDVGELKTEMGVLEPAATSSDVGKFLKAKTVSDGKVTEYEFGSGGGGGAVEDVQINGTSILSGGVANIVKATDAQVKAGAETGKLLVPFVQDASVFYGLAKAAGDTTQSTSDNAVGVYTDAAKNSICNMLGVNRRMRLLKKISVIEDTSSVGFDIDETGHEFEVDELLVFAFLPSTNSAQNLYYGIETTELTTSSAKWVAKINNATHASRKSIVVSKIKRYNDAWRCFHFVGTTSASSFSDGIGTTESGNVSMSLNGASWVVTNKPEYATMFAITLSGNLINAGCAFEIYAHDYQG